MSGLLLILIVLCLQALLSVMCNAHHILLVSKQLQLNIGNSLPQISLQNPYYCKIQDYSSENPGFSKERGSFLYCVCCERLKKKRELSATTVEFMQQSSCACLICFSMKSGSLNNYSCAEFGAGGHQWQVLICQLGGTCLLLYPEHHIMPFTHNRSKLNPATWWRVMKKWNQWKDKLRPTVALLISFNLMSQWVKRWKIICSGLEFASQSRQKPWGDS